MNSKSIIEGQRIKELFTRFYYQENHLCYQIIAYSDAEATNSIFEKEYFDYNEYSKAFKMLHVAKSNKSQVSLSEKTEKVPPLSARQTAC